MKMNNILSGKIGKTLAFVGLGSLALVGTAILNNKNADFLNVHTSVIGINEPTKIEYDLDQMIYLSDMDYIPSLSGTKWGSILKDITSAGSLINVKIQGANYNFAKGMWAHATSTLVYDLTEYDYNYFIGYIGLNSTAASTSNGIKYYIYTSEDKSNWVLKTAENPRVIKAGDNADYVKVDISDANYLKIYINDNGSNGNDHAVIADGKLVKSLESVNFVKSVEEYDEIIKNKYANSEMTEEFEHILLQRELVSRAGDYALNRFASESTENANFLSYFLNDYETLRLYVLGGTPAGSYYNSLNVLKRLFDTYKEDFSITEVTKYGTVLGDLYRKMAVTISLTHSARVSLWMQPNAPENQSDAVTRYEIYKMLHKEGKFVVSARQDHTKWFEDLNVEEMRFIFNNIIDDEEILWLNEYTQKYIDSHPNQEETYLQPHKYMKYIWPNYSKPEYHDEANKEMYSAKYGNFLDYGVTFRPGLYKLWMNLDNGAVCGGISKIGTNIRAVHGTPSAVIGQPGHAAIIYYRQTANGDGYWSIDNDVSGWQQSEKGERMLLGWGNDKRYITGYSVSYIVMAQEAINRQEALEKSQELVMLANVYASDKVKKEAYLRAALETLEFNADAWYDLITLYKSDNTKTEEDFYNLAVELTESLMEFPLPLRDLLAQIAPKFTSNNYKFKYSLLLTNTLKKGASLNASTKVQQPGVTRTMANYLLGKTDTTLATFSFNGEKAGKIVLSSRFDGSGIRIDYSIDGKNTWKEVFLGADDEHSIQLTDAEVDLITAENDIYVHIVGTAYDDENLYKIDILKQTNPTVYNNDLENRVIGVTNVTEWKMEGTNTWKLFKDELPDLTGDKTIIVRNERNGVYLRSGELTLNFTQDTDTPNRKYVSIDRLSIEAVSSEATAQNRYAKYMIDGNIYTSWHSAWNGSDLDKYIVIGFDKAINLSAIEYLPLEGANGKILNAQILGSLDGENFFEIVSSTSWANDASLKNVEITEAPKVKYVKIVGTKTSSASSSLSFMAGKMFNFYEDTTKINVPAAEIQYSTVEPTNQDVIVTLINPTTFITITNNNSQNTYTFTENGTFTFEFVDENGVKGSATATVTNIDKESPSADISYSEKELTNQDVTVTLTNISEDAIVANNNGNNTYTFIRNGEFTFILTDKAGNVTEITAEVNNIDKVIPKAQVIYNTLESGEVVATLTNATKPIVIINNDGKQTHTFTKNGIFIFMFKDAAGNLGSAIATVKSINDSITIIEDNPITDNKSPGVTIQENNSYNNNFVTPNENDKNEITNNTLTNGIFTITIEDGINNLKFRAVKNALTDSLINILGENTEFYNLYLENQQGDVIELTKKIILEIKPIDNKIIEGVYAVGSDNILEPLNFSVKDGKTYVEIEALANIVIDYSDEKEEKIISETNNQEEAKKENRANYNIVLIGAMLVAAGITGLVLSKKKDNK